MGKKKAEKKARRRLEKKLRKAGFAESLDLRLALAGIELGRNGILRRLAGLGELEDQLPLALLSLALMGAGQTRGDPVLRRAGMRMLTALLLASGGKTTVKRLVARTRPARFARTGQHHVELFGPHVRPLDAFPSGHMAGGAAVAKALAADYPEHERALVATALILAACKVVRGDHFPSDLLAGYPIGLASARAAGRLFPSAA